MARAYHLLTNYRQELEVTRQARDSFPEAISLSSDEVRVLAALGEIEDVNKVIDECLRMPPRPITPGGVMLQAAEELRAHGHLAASREVIERALDWSLSRPREEAATETNRYGLARILYLAERWEEAKEIFEELHLEHPDNIGYLGYLGSLAVREGDSEQAKRISADLENVDRPYSFGRNVYWRACIAALQGDQEQAVQLLRDAFAQGLAFNIRFHRDINLEPLRDYPPFQELLRPKG
jgi:tetratricopeptide (TPR) repeat protein